MDYSQQILNKLSENETEYWFKSLMNSKKEGMHYTKASNETKQYMMETNNRLNTIEADTIVIKKQMDKLVENDFTIKDVKIALFEAFEKKEKDFKKRFASKRVEVLVYGLVAVVLMTLVKTMITDYIK